MAVRVPAVAGLFYPREAGVLRNMVQCFLQDATAHAPLAKRPRVVIVPHAGYVYSGAVAANAYRELQAIAGSIQRVVLLGPAHRVAFRGMALPTTTAFATPLGNIPLDIESMAALQGLPGVIAHDQPHATEHSLEVQLPFLQTVLGEFSLIPVVVGEASPDQVAALCDAVERDDTVIVVSTDLSHYLPYAVANRVDQQTISQVLQYDARLAGEQACGCRPLNGVLQWARGKQLHIELLDYRNSGDTAGDRERVVGYAAFALHE